MHQDFPLLLRFLSKFVLDILPAAFASVIGGFLFTQYHMGRAAEPKPPAEQATPASAEMMQLVRDEHALLVDVLKAQVTAEKTRIAAERAAAARAVAEAAEAAQAAQAEQVARAAAAMRRVADAGSAARTAAPRAKAQAVKPADPVGAPLVIAQAEPRPAAAERPSGIRAKTVEIADNVVAGTRKVAAAIVSIPTWIVSLGERLGRPPARNPDQEGRFASAW